MPLMPGIDNGHFLKRALRPYGVAIAGGAGIETCEAVHHCLAFIPGPASFNHAAFEMRGLDEMMRGVGRPAAEGPRGGDIRASIPDCG